MQPSLPALALLAVGVFGSGLALGIGVWQLLNGGRSLPNYLLILAWMAAGWWITMGGLVYAGLAEHFPGLFTSDIPLIYLIGPCFYVATHLRSGLLRWRRQLLLHALPFGLALLLILPGMAGGTELKRTILHVTYNVRLPEDLFRLSSARLSLHETYPYLLVLIKVLAKVSMIAYASLVVWRAPHLVRRPAGPRSVLALRAYASLGVAAAFVSMMSHFSGLAGAGIAVLVGTIALVGIQIIDGLFALSHSAENAATTLRRTERSVPGKSPRVAGLDPAKILARLQQLMEGEQLHCDEDLSLARLAAHLEIRPDQLSYVLNQYANQNFNTYVNGFRLAHAKELLLNSTDSIAQVAHAVGFNSQQVFSLVFRKQIGLTPGQYRERFGKER